MYDNDILHYDLGKFQQKYYKPNRIEKKINQPLDRGGSRNLRKRGRGLCDSPNRQGVCGPPRPPEVLGLHMLSGTLITVSLLTILCPI